MQTRYQPKNWASFSVYAIAFLLLVFSINKISCEHEAIDLAKHPEDGYLIEHDVDDPIDKCSTDEDDAGTSDDVVDVRNTNTSPLRLGTRMLEESLMRQVRATPLRLGKRSVDSQLMDMELYSKRAPSRWGKRAPSRFGKRAPSRFGKREYKRAPMRFRKREGEEMRDPRIHLNLNDMSSLGKRRDPRLHLDLNDISSLGKKRDPRMHLDLNALMNGLEDYDE